MSSRESKRDGYRWIVAESYSNPAMVPWDKQPGWVRMDPNAVPDSYTVADRMNLSIVKGTYDTREKAERRAAALNRADAESGMDPAFHERRAALRRLGETFWVRYGEGHRDSRWPNQPGRFAVESFSERYGESFWETRDSREDVEAAIADGADRVVDLDTGEDVPFERSVAVRWPDRAEVQMEIEAEMDQPVRASFRCKPCAHSHGFVAKDSWVGARLCPWCGARLVEEGEHG